VNWRILKVTIWCAYIVLFCLPAYGGLIGDPVTSILHTMAAGSWSNSDAVVGPGVEFIQTYNPSCGGPCQTISLDIDDSSFTLRFVNNFEGRDNNPSGTFNLGLEGFEFTDLNQTFTGITFAGSTGGFPVASITGTSVTENTIRIFMDNPLIPGQGTEWTATWNIEAAEVAIPEPGAGILVGLGVLALLATTLRRKSRAAS
jgi:hypothetical protein